MDIFSHGLYGSAAFGRKNKRYFWYAFLLGIAPDFFSFGIFAISNILGIEKPVGWSNSPPPMDAIPEYVHVLYDITHSFIPFLLVFLVVWLITKKPFIPMLAWPLHIICDIFLHSLEFFPTPFLWPLSDYRFNGISWGEPKIFWSYISALLLIYLFLGIKKYNKDKML